MNSALALLLLAGTIFGQTVQTEVCVYGGSAAGAMAAIQVARMGSSVALVEPGRHIGGLSVEGLGSSDINNHEFRNDIAIGGLARDFYRRIGSKYGRNEPQYLFESHVAEQVFNEMVHEAGVKVFLSKRLAETAGSVLKDSARRITAIRTEDGAAFHARVFIDATIEGDLVAAAGVTTVIGRESNATYGETKNGIRSVNEYRQFTVKIDPYVKPGDPSSGVIPTIQNEPLGTPGAGDHRVQAYCFRLCLTRDPSNRLPIEKPATYDPWNYEIYRRYIQAGGELFYPMARLPNGKTDLGSWHDLSANFYGMNHAYPGGNYATRERIYREHREFTQGLMYFLVHDPAVPDALKARWRDWGLCMDEFTDNGGWPRALYVRDARRMVSDYVITEHHTRRVNPTPVPDPVAVAYWPPDTHHVRRIIRDGFAYNEGFVFGGDDWGPFGVSYRAMTPRRSEAVNLLTPACLSSSHVAYGAVRIEWTFMALGQSAGTAAVLALEQGMPVQNVPYEKLRAHLLRDGQVLSLNLVEKKQ